MLPNIIKEQSISAANGGHSPCDELSIGLVSSSSRSRLGQTIVLILPGGDTHQHNHQRSVSSYTMCDRSYASFTSDSSHKLESWPQCFCMGENFTTIKSFHIYWAKKNTNVQSTTISILHFHCMKKEAPVDTRARTRPGGCNMSDDSISECTSQLWSSPGRVLLMVLAATISARLLLAAGHPQYCLLCRGQHFGHRYCDVDVYTFYC